MKVKVLFQSRKGNTEKVANAIAQAIDISGAEQVPPGFMPENQDLMFIGGGIYAGKPDKTLHEFVNILQTKHVKNVALFGTFGGQDKALQMMKSILEGKGINVMDEIFLCKGNFFLFFNRNHPDDGDLKAAAAFAKRIVAQVEKNK